MPSHLNFLTICASIFHIVYKLFHKIPLQIFIHQFFILALLEKYLIILKSRLALSIIVMIVVEALQHHKKYADWWKIHFYRFLPSMMGLRGIEKKVVMSNIKEEVSHEDSVPIHQRKVMKIRERIFLYFIHD